MQRPAVNPYLAVFLGVVAVSFSAIFTKLAEAPPAVIAFYRLGFTVLLLGPFCFTGAAGKLPPVRSRDVMLACLSGAMLALHFAVWIASLNYTSVASSTVLVTMQPLFVMAGGYIFYREKLSLQGIAGALLAIGGSILIGISDFQIGGKALFGDILAFAGAGLMAGYMLIGRGLRRRFSLLHYILVVYGVSCLILLLIILLTGGSLGPYPGGTWLWLLALALVPTIMGHTVFNWALRYVKAAVVSVSILGEPVGASILAYFIFHQVPTFMQVCGSAVTLLGLGIFIFSPRE